MRTTRRFDAATIRRVAQRWALAVTLAALGVAGPMRPLAAQTLEGTPSQLVASNSCLDHLPMSVFTRVPVYAMVSGRDSALSPAARNALLSGADVLLQLVAERTRAMLAPGAPDSVLPHGDPALGDSLRLWRNFGGRVELTAFRDGGLRWRVPPMPHDDPWAALLLARALDSLRATNDAHVWWPSDSAGQFPDSVRFDFVFRWPSVSRDGKATPVTVERPAQPLFSIPMPWEEGVRVAKAAKPRYPRDPLYAGYRATVLLVFVVDTNGVPDPKTTHDLWPSKARSLNDSERKAYADFVAASREAAMHTRFEPARIGGCAVRQSVQQPYEYDIAR